MQTPLLGNSVPAWLTYVDAQFFQVLPAYLILLQDGIWLFRLHDLMVEEGRVPELM